MYLDNLIAWKLEARNMHSITSHQIAVENSKDRLMSNDQQIILLTLQFENNWFKSDSKVVI